jgi:hypothetical protein
MQQFTELQTLRQTIALDKQDLQRFLADRITNAESIATVNQIIAKKEARIAILATTNTYA